MSLYLGFDSSTQSLTAIVIEVAADGPGDNPHFLAIPVRRWYKPLHRSVLFL